ncbi:MULTISPECIES: hypothetical protein [unclassified Pantoea]|uniref:hypothetical protein n=1 Tax=unclassified Pantoea TaxID=2630326 RepID=UPI00301C61A7
MQNGHDALFDLNLRAIEPNDKTMHFSDCAVNNCYKEFNGEEMVINHVISKTPLKMGFIRA